MATSSLIGALRVTLGLDSAEFEKGVDRSKRQLDVIERAGFRTGRMLRGLGGLAATAAVTLGGVFTSRMIKGGLDYAASIGEVAAQLGVTQRELQVFRYAATQVNLTQEEMERGLARLTLSIGKAGNGARTEAHYFAELGIAIRDSEGNIRATGDVLNHLADRLKDIPDPASRAAAVYALLGRQGQKLIPLLEGGSEGLARFAKEAEEAGHIIADGDIARADETADKIEALTAQLKVSVAREVARNADAIGDLTGSISGLVGALVRMASWFAQNQKIAALVFGGAAGARFGGPWGALAGSAAGFLLTPEGQRTPDEIREQIADLQKKGAVVAGGARGVLGELFTIRNADKNAPAYREQLAQLRRDLAAAEAREASIAAAAAAADTSDLFDLSGATGGGAARGGDETARIRDQLEALREDVESTFAFAERPAAVEAAEDLRRKLAELADDARKAGVPMAQFSGQVAGLKERISELETEGLAREADEFGRAVFEMGRRVDDADVGALTPLSRTLADINDRYDTLRERIEDQIAENTELAARNDQAALALGRLRDMLVQVGEAHDTARAAAIAQYRAEQELRDLAADQAALRIEGEIADLSRARGDGGPVAPRRRELEDIERQLQEERNAAAQRLRGFELDLLAAEEAKDAEEANRLRGLIDLAGEYYDLVSDTTAQQIVAGQRLQDTFDDFTQGLSDALVDMVTQFDFSLRSFAQVFVNALNQQFLRPAANDAAGFVATTLRSLFAGGFATGGTIPRGQWGIVGERGPEPVFAGDRPLRVLPNDTLGGGQRNVFNINVTGPMSERERRQTGSQIASAAMARMAAARKAGLAGSVER